MGVSTFFQMLIAGLVVGSVYGLLALGYLTIYRCCGVVNLAQGAFAMLAALVAIYLVRDVELPYPVSALIAVGVTAILGLLMYLLVVERVRVDLVVTQFMATLGVSMLIEGIALVLAGGYPRTLPPFTADTPWKLGGVNISQQGVWVWLMTIFLVVTLYLLNNHTTFGKKMTATATDPLAASLVGISRRAMISWAFILSAVIGAAAGLSLAAIVPMNYASGSAYGFKGFIAGVLGGWGKGSGALMGGLVLGVIETFGSMVLPGYRDAIAFLVLILILYFRPSGLMGSSLVEEW